MSSRVASSTARAPIRKRTSCSSSPWGHPTPAPRGSGRRLPSKSSSGSELQGRVVRAGRGAPGDAGCGVRGRRRTHRRLRALLLVHRRNGHVPRRRGDRSRDRRAGERRARARAPGRDRRPGRPRQRGRGGLACRPPVRGAGGGRLSAPRRVRATLYTDGGARGNPGPAAYAYVLEADDGHVLAAHGEAIGVATNNVAEYRALVEGLAKAVEVGVDELEVVSDSELLVKQMRGEYKVKNRALQELFLEASRLARGIHRVTYTAVRRESNELADSLVNEALDRAVS